jgi:hypothetical protein
MINIPILLPHKLLGLTCGASRACLLPAPVAAQTNAANTTFVDPKTRVSRSDVPMTTDTMERQAHTLAATRRGDHGAASTQIRITKATKSGVSL